MVGVRKKERGKKEGRRDLPVNTISRRLFDLHVSNCIQRSRFIFQEIKKNDNT